jgi:signal transduction histidine kinase
MKDLLRTTRTDLINGLAHNINTPLNLILGFAQQAQSANPQLDQLQKIINAGLRIDDILNQTIKNIQFRESFETGYYDLIEIVRNQISALMNNLKIKRGLALKLSLPTDPLMISTISALPCLLFEHILCGLSEQNGIPLEISVKSIDNDAAITLVCEDRQIVWHELIPDMDTIHRALHKPVDAKLYQIEPSNTGIIITIYDKSKH